MGVKPSGAGGASAARLRTTSSNAHRVIDRFMGDDLTVGCSSWHWAPRPCMRGGQSLPAKGEKPLARRVAWARRPCHVRLLLGRRLPLFFHHLLRPADLLEGLQ